MILRETERASEGCCEHLKRCFIHQINYIRHPRGHVGSKASSAQCHSPFRMNAQSLAETSRRRQSESVQHISKKTSCLLKFSAHLFVFFFFLPLLPINFDTLFKMFFNPTHYNDKRKNDKHDERMAVKDLKLQSVQRSFFISWTPD